MRATEWQWTHEGVARAAILPSPSQSVLLTASRWFERTERPTSLVSTAAEHATTPAARFDQAARTAPFSAARTTETRPMALEAIASKLAQVASVTEVYMNRSGRAIQVWTVVHETDNATLSALFQHEVELYGDFGNHLSPIEFHVLTRTAASSLELGDKIYERERP